MKIKFHFKFAAMGFKGCSIVILFMSDMRRLVLSMMIYVVEKIHNYNKLSEMIKNSGMSQSFWEWASTWHSRCLATLSGECTSATSWLWGLHFGVRKYDRIYIPQHKVFWNIDCFITIHDNQSLSTLPPFRWSNYNNSRHIMSNHLSK